MNSNAQRSRPAPAFQEYASDMLANSRYRTMSLAERGLMDTMRRECWVNGSVPKELRELAVYLAKPESEVIAALSMRVLNFFKEQHDQLVCPELDAYRAILEDRSKKMSQGGRNGGKVTQNKNRVAKATLEAMVKPLNRDEMNRDELSGEEKRSLGKGISIEEMNKFVAEYDGTPAASNTYYQASKGGP